MASRAFRPLSRFLRPVADVLDFEGSGDSVWADGPDERAVLAATRRLIQAPLTTIAHGIKISKLVLHDETGKTHSVGRRVMKKNVTARELTISALQRALDPSRPGSTPDVAEWGLQALSDGEEAVEIIYRIVEDGYFDFMQQNGRSQVLEVYGWLAAHESEEVNHVFRERQASVRAEVAAGLEVMLTREGREPVAGSSYSEIAALCVGLVEGSMMQHNLDPESFDGGALAAAATGIIATLSAPPGAPMTARDRAEETWSSVT